MVAAASRGEERVSNAQRLANAGGHVVNVWPRQFATIRARHKSPSRRTVARYVRVMTAPVDAFSAGRKVDYALEMIYTWPKLAQEVCMAIRGRKVRQLRELHRERGRERRRRHRQDMDIQREIREEDEEFLAAFHADAQHARMGGRLSPREARALGNDTEVAAA